MLRLLGFCAALFVIVLTVSLAVLTLSPSYNECVRKNGQHSTEQYTANGQEIIEGPIENPTAFRLALICGSFFANRNGEAFTGLFTIALTIATFLLGYLAWDQGQTSRTQLSAFVFVEDFRPFFEIDADTPQPRKTEEPRNVDRWAFRPIWRNNGETQTSSFTNHVDYEYRESPLPLGFKFPDNHSGVARMLLGPKSHGTGGSPHSFTVEELNSVKSQQRFLYMWGWLRYGSVFRTRQHRVTRYCIQVIVIGDPSRSNCPFQWLVHTEGNCSDAECVAQGLG